MRNWLREDVASLPKKSVGRGGETDRPLCRLIFLDNLLYLVSQVWSLLCAGDADEAIRVASEGGMMMLSLMISTTFSTEQIGRQDCANMVCFCEFSGSW